MQRAGETCFKLDDSALHVAYPTSAGASDHPAGVVPQMQQISRIFESEMQARFSLDVQNDDAAETGAHCQNMSLSA